jgi:hypothetical protein
LAVLLGGCDSTLTVEPTEQVESGKAIVDAPSARAAQAGMYDALQSGSYYGGDFFFFSDLPSDDVTHPGTFTTYADANAHVTTADNSTIEAIWDAIYQATDRANQLIVRIPGIAGLGASEADQIVGEAHFLRALHYHNLVKLWGDVPLVLTPPPSIEEASQVSRASAPEVYAQILADLTTAEQKMSIARQSRKGSIGAVRALRSRVMLFQGNWAGAEAAATSVMGMGYSLASPYSALFTPEGDDTPEDIFKTSFTAQESQIIGYYYLSSSFGGRREVGPTTSLETFYEAGDPRKTWSVARDSRNRLYGSKWPTAVGAEDIHVIRLGEVILNRAEARAQQGNLAGAVADYNLIRARAGLAPHVLGVNVTTQAQVLAAVYRERRAELAMEGSRWPDLVRRGEATTNQNIPAFRTLFPIPQNELDVAPNLVQNPGY